MTEEEITDKQKPLLSDYAENQFLTDIFLFTLTRILGKKEAMLDVNKKRQQRRSHGQEILLKLFDLFSNLNNKTTCNHNLRLCNLIFQNKRLPVGGFLAL